MKPFILALMFAVASLFMLPDRAIAADGKALYETSAPKCVTCHKADGSGINASASLISAESKAKTDAQLKAVIKNGAENAKPKMKAYTFSDEELGALVKYIRTLQK